MAMILTGIGSLLGGGATAATVAVPGIAGASTLMPAAASGISLASILQGTATVLGVVSSIAGGNAEADALNAQAIDAEREQEIETLSGIERRASIKATLAEALGQQDVAYAASGVDLSWGTASQARREAYREADLAITSAASTELTRNSRLMERAANYRASAKRARSAGIIQGLTGGLQGAASLAGRY